MRKPNLTLKAFRVVRGLTQVDLGKVIKKAASTYSNKENGKSDFTSSEINLILKEFNAKYEDLFLPQ
jgi:putative transcriptional regulator